MRIFIALIIYISIISTLNIKSFQAKSSNATYKLIEFITFYYFKQIKCYFYILALSIIITLTCLLLSHQHLKLELLTSLLYTKFKTFIILGQNVSFNKIMILYFRRLKHTLKIKNKLIKEGFKIWALCDYTYL